MNKDIDFVKIVLGAITGIATVIMPILITWLVKNFKALKNSEEETGKLRKELEDEIKNQKNLNGKFKISMYQQLTEVENKLNTKLSEAVSSLTKDLDRKIGLSNYELDKNRKGIDEIFNRLLKSVDTFDEKVKDSSTRLKSELVSKESYYKETSQFKDDFFRELYDVRKQLQGFEPSPTNLTEMFGGMDSLVQMAEKLVSINKHVIGYNEKTNYITKDLLSLNKNVEILDTKFRNEKLENSKKHNLTRRLLSSELNTRKHIEIKIAKIKEDSKIYNAKMKIKLDTYNKLVEGFSKLNK